MSVSGFLSRTRLVVAGLAIVALVLGTLIYRDIFVPSKSAANALNLYTVSRRTVTATITGSGNLVPQQQANVSFKVAGELTAIDVHVGDHVSAGQTLATIDSSAEQNALAQAQANLAVAQANLQSAQTPLTQYQVQQLQDSVTTAQQTYNDTVTQVNLTNTQDANQVTADQGQLAMDQQSLTFNATYQNDLVTLGNDKTTLQAALTTFDNDATCTGVSYANYSPQCLSEFNAVAAAQSAVNAEQLAVNCGVRASGRRGLARPLRRLPRRRLERGQPEARGRESVAARALAARDPRTDSSRPDYVEDWLRRSSMTSARIRSRS